MTESLPKEKLDKWKQHCSNRSWSDEKNVA